jgi:hypothetical protein
MLGLHLHVSQNQKVASSTGIPVVVWAGLVLCQGYIPIKSFANGNHVNQTQIYYLKQYIDDLSLFSV